jgi:hypothetical protein
MNIILIDAIPIIYNVICCEKGSAEVLSLDKQTTMTPCSYDSYDPMSPVLSPVLDPVLSPVLDPVLDPRQIDAITTEDFLDNLVEIYNVDNLVDIYKMLLPDLLAYENISDIA